MFVAKVDFKYVTQRNKEDKGRRTSASLLTCAKRYLFINLLFMKKQVTWQHRSASTQCLATGLRQWGRRTQRLSS